MPGVLPLGEAPSVDGSLPDLDAAAIAARPLSAYVHVPFCASRCGYCDFNTYTSAELGGGASLESFASTAQAEIRLAARVLDGAGPLQTVFFGGGTPTLLAPADLVRLLDELRGAFGIATGAEVTTEANPESVDAASLAALRDGGFTRISFGMQSSSEHVLAVLDRRHTPGRTAQAVAEARAAGFDDVNVDLIYGTPGETDADWAASLQAAVATGADHVSAYALQVEDGTRLAARVRRGEVPLPDDDVLADRYVQADELLAAAGFGWYEVSNWARAGRACRHNLAYWRSDNWWGVGPGAHSHVSDGSRAVRWWNVRHPRAYAERLGAGESPAHSRERLTAEDRRVESVLLRLRLDEGCPVDLLRPAGRRAAARAGDDGLLDPRALSAGRCVLTRRGRLLADAVVRELVD